MCQDGTEGCSLNSNSTMPPHPAATPAGEASGLIRPADLHETAGNILTAADETAALAALLDAVIGVQGAAMGNVQVVNPRTRTLDIVVQRGFPPRLLEPYLSIDASDDETVCGRALCAGGQVVVEDVMVDAGYAPHRGLAVAAGFRGVVSSPLVTRDGELLGIVSTHFREPHRPSEAALQLTDLHVRFAAEVVTRVRATEALRESDRKLRVALGAAELGAWTYSFADARWELDERAQQLYGTGAAVCRHDEGLLRRLMHPDDVPLMWQRVREATDPAGEGRYACDYRFLQPDGSYRWLSAWAQVTFEGEGPQRRAVRMVGSTRDVTDSRTGEQALRRSEARFRFLSDLGERTRDLADPEQVMAAVARALGEHLCVCRCAYAEVEADSDAFTIRHDYTNQCPSSVGTYRLDQFGPRAAADQRAGRTLVIHDVDAELGASEGGDTFRSIGIRAVVCCPLVRRGRLVAMMAVHQTAPRRWTADEVALVEEVVERSWAYIERARALRSVAANEARLRELADAMPQMVWVTRPDGYHEYYNKRWYEFTGVPDGSTDGEAWNGVFHPDDQGRAWAAWRRSLATGEPYEVEYRLRHHSGEYRWTLGRALPIRDAAGATVRWYGTCTDIDTLKRLQGERESLLASERAAREEAERASEAKSEFLATLSHELRTPLTPVLLTVSLMESHPGLPPDLREDVATIRRNVELESRLISDLLDLTRISNGKMQLDEQDVDLHLVVRRAIDICQREASAKLTVDLRASRHTVRGDSTRLQQVFWNLVNNAIKFTPADGTVTVRSRDAGDGRVAVEVSDTGAGIDPAVLPRLFNAFEQGEARPARTQAGLGLGLAISKKLAEAHGGTITVTSAGRGRGATFTVELPAAEAPLRAAAHQPAPSLAKAARPLNVLLVEDHAPSLRVMEKLLRRIGHRVTGVTSVASATAAAGQDGYDLIISDLGLPDGSGLDIMRGLRDRYAGRSIALTGYGMESDIAASRAAGFAEHLTKPVDFAALDAAIRRVFADA